MGLTCVAVEAVVLPFFVQLEIRVELQSEYCRYDVMLSYGAQSASVVADLCAVEAACTTVLRAIGDSCRIAK